MSKVAKESRLAWTLAIALIGVIAGFLISQDGDHRSSDVRSR